MKHDPKREEWERRYRAVRRRPRAAAVLLRNRHLLPVTGRSLDLACGLGGNALLLARLGLESHAWDFAEPALAALRTQAAHEGLRIHACLRDVVGQPPEQAGFDVIVVSHFLHRELADDLVRALRPGGLLLYQTFTREAVDDSGPSNPAFRLAENELLGMFVPPLRLRYYREEGRCGDHRRGLRNLALLVGQRSGG